MSGKYEIAALLSSWQAEDEAEIDRRVAERTKQLTAELEQMRGIKAAAENLIKTHYGETDMSLGTAIGLLEAATKGGGG